MPVDHIEYQANVRAIAKNKLASYINDNGCDELIYLAGLFVGEGHCGTNAGHKRKCNDTYPLLCELGMNDVRTVKRFARLVRQLRPTSGDTCVQYRQQKFTRLARVCCSGTTAEAVMRALFPYMRDTDKGDQVRMAFQRSGIEIL